MWGWWSYRALNEHDRLDTGMVHDAYRALVTMAATERVPQK
jgi:hypothetical protein